MIKRYTFRLQLPIITSCIPDGVWLDEKKESRDPRLVEMKLTDVRLNHLEVDPTEASLLHCEIWRDLKEARSKTFLLNGWSLVTPFIRPRVMLPPEREQIWLSFTFHSWSHQHAAYFCSVSKGRLNCPVCHIHLERWVKLKTKLKVFYGVQ